MQRSMRSLFVGLIIFALLLAGTPVAAAQHGADFRLLDHLGGPGPRALFVEGDIVYYGDQDILRIADLAGQGGPQVLGALPLDFAIMAIRVVGTYAYVSATALPTQSYVNTASALYVIDVADPATPRLARRIALREYITSLEIYRGHLYLAGAVALGIYSLAEPSAPARLATLPGSRLPRYGLAFAGDLMYVSSGPIVDIADPAAPAVISRAPTAQYSYSVDVAGDYAYYGSAGRLKVVEVSVPTLSLLRGEAVFEGPSAPVFTHTFVSGDTAYLAAGAQLYVLDVSNKVNPTVAKSCRCGPIADMRLTPAGLYLARPEGIALAEFPAGTGIAIRQLIAAPAAIQQFATDGNLLVAISPSHHLIVYEVRDGVPAYFVELARVTGIQANSVFLNGALAYLFVGDAVFSPPPGGGMSFVIWLVVVDLSEPAAPVLRGRIPLPVEAHQLLDQIPQIRLDGTTLSVRYQREPDFESVTCFLDVADPDAPQRLACFNGTRSYLSGGLAYTLVADRLRVTTVSEREQLRGIFELKWASDIAVSGTIVYAAHGGELQVLDASDPAHIWPIGALPLDEYYYKLALHGDRLYAYTNSFIELGRRGLQIIDVSAPASPRAEGGYRPALADLSFSDGVLFARELSRLSALDPATGNACCGYSVSASTAMHVVAGGRAYLLDSTGTLYLLELPEQYSFVPERYIYLPLLRR